MTISERYEKVSLWTRLKQADRPVVLYGTGNGADRILDIFESSGISVSGVFASDGFVRDRYFRGYRVKSYDDITAEFGDGIIIVLAFGSSLPGVIEFIRELDSRHELIIPEIPLYGGSLFDEDYLESKLMSAEKTRNMLADGISRQLFDDAVNFRLSGKLRYAELTEPFEKSLKSLLSGRCHRNVLDGGAYRGDTACSIISALMPEKVYAAEPDRKTFVKLCEYAGVEKRAEVIPVNAALSSEPGTMPFSSQGSRGSGRTGAGKRARQDEVMTTTIDGIAPEDGFQLIKLDIEGLEAQALRGAAAVLAEHRSDLIVSLYHRTDDLFEIPDMVSAMLPGHRLYLRRVPCLPMWDLNLFAVSDDGNA